MLTTVMPKVIVFAHLRFWFKESIAESDWVWLRNQSDNEWIIKCKNEHLYIIKILLLIFYIIIRFFKKVYYYLMLYLPKPFFTTGTIGVSRTCSHPTCHKIAVWERVCTSQYTIFHEKRSNARSGTTKPVWWRIVQGNF